MGWLSCTQADVTAINAALPPNTRVAPLQDANQLLFIGDDLQGDCGTKQTYAAAASIINSLLSGVPVITAAAKVLPPSVITS